MQFYSKPASFVFTETMVWEEWHRCKWKQNVWAFCFITQQTSWILQLSPCGSFMHLLWCWRWCLSKNWNFWGKDIAIRKCFLILILLWNGYRWFLPIIPALLTQISVHQDRWRLEGPEEIYSVVNSCTFQLRKWVRVLLFQGFKLCLFEKKCKYPDFSSRFKNKGRELV